MVQNLPCVSHLQVGLTTPSLPWVPAKRCSIESCFSRLCLDPLLCTLDRMFISLVFVLLQIWPHAGDKTTAKAASISFDAELSGTLLIKSEVGNIQSVWECVRVCTSKAKRELAWRRCGLRDILSRHYSTVHAGVNGSWNSPVNPFWLISKRLTVKCRKNVFQCDSSKTNQRELILFFGPQKWNFAYPSF